MDFFDRSYYKIVKILTSMIGRWSFQSLAGRYFFTSIYVSLFLFQVTGEISAVVVYFDDKGRILESIPPLITDTIGAAKYINNVYNSSIIKDLFNQIKENWGIYTGKVEQSILHSYSKYAKIFSYGYVGLGYTTTTLFLTEPILPRLWCALMSINETIPIRYATPVYWYGFDLEEDYYYLVSFSNMGELLILVSNSTMDVLFITLMQHAAGLFAITGYMMEHIPTQKDLEHETELQKYSISGLENIQYKYYVECIKSHTRAIKFAEDLDAVYVWCLGIIITLNVIMLSITATQVLNDMNMPHPFESWKTVATQAQTSEQITKFVIFAVAQLLHIFIFCFFSQRLMTTSANIQQCICNGLWYECTPKTQKLLTLVMLRSQLPCKLTAGKAVILSMETFTVIVKTSASYFTVLMSMQ